MSEVCDGSGWIESWQNNGHGQQEVSGRRRCPGCEKCKKPNVIEARELRPRRRVTPDGTEW